MAKSEKRPVLLRHHNMARRNKTFKPDKDLRTIRHQEQNYFCKKAAEV